MEGDRLRSGLLNLAEKIWSGTVIDGRIGSFFDCEAGIPSNGTIFFGTFPGSCSLGGVASPRKLEY